MHLVGEAVAEVIRGAVEEGVGQEVGEARAAVYVGRRWRWVRKRRNQEKK